MLVQDQAHGNSEMVKNARRRNVMLASVASVCLQSAPTSEDILDYLPVDTLRLCSTVSVIR